MSENRHLRLTLAPYACEHIYVNTPLHTKVGGRDLQAGPIFHWGSDSEGCGPVGMRQNQREVVLLDDRIRIQRLLAEEAVNGVMSSKKDYIVQLFRYNSHRFRERNVQEAWPGSFL